MVFDKFVVKILDLTPHAGVVYCLSPLIDDGCPLLSHYSNRTAGRVYQYLYAEMLAPNEPFYGLKGRAHECPIDVGTLVCVKRIHEFLKGLEVGYRDHF